MSGEVLKSDAQQISEHGHVDGQSPEVVGKVSFRKHALDQIYHDLKEKNENVLRQTRSLAPFRQHARTDIIGILYTIRIYIGIIFIMVCTAKYRSLVERV